MSKVLIDWLGEGGFPVSQDLADARSAICRGCSENVEPNWWGKVKMAAAETIKHHLEAKHLMGLSVPNESELGMCKVCGCCVPLKVWVPIKHISAHTSQDLFEAYPPHCWQKKELTR